MSGGFEAQHAAKSIWAAATMGVDDPRVVNGLARACLDRVRDFTAQDSANSIWTIATLKLLDLQVRSALAQACVDSVRAAANSIWAAATFHVSECACDSSLFSWTPIG